MSSFHPRYTQPLGTYDEQTVSYIGRPIACATCHKVHPVRRPQAVRDVPTLGDHLRDIGEIVVGTLTLLASFAAIGLWSWIAWAAQ
jgi:hypothetical protein